MAENICVVCKKKYKGRIESKYCSRSCYAKVRKGVPRTKDTALKMSKALTGRKLSENHKRNISKGGMGHLVSTETRNKISRAKMGHTTSKETRTKISKSLFQGNLVTKNTGRQRAQRMYPETQPCETCGCYSEETIIHRHHLDGNPLNNEENNIEFLCASCHIKEHWRRRHLCPL